DLYKFEKSIVFGIGYAATIAGSGTLISGTANPIMAAQANQLFDVTITFGQVMAVGVPYVALFILIAWLFITTVKYKTTIKEIPGGKQIIQDEKNKLGKINYEEKVVLTVFVSVAFLLITRSFIWSNILLDISHQMLAIIAVVILCSIPPASTEDRVFEWEDTK